MLDRNGYVCHRRKDEELIYFHSIGMELIGSEEADMKVGNQLVYIHIRMNKSPVKRNIM